MIDLTSDIEELRELTQNISLTEPLLIDATVSALNETIEAIHDFAVKRVTEDYNVSPGEVLKELRISEAHSRRLEAKLIGTGSPGIPLYEFSPTPKRAPSTQRLGSGGYSPKKGIKVEVRRGERKLARSAFIAKMPSGHVGVFRRMDRGLGAWWSAFSGNGNIKELYGPSPVRILAGLRMNNLIYEFADAEFEKNMSHEADFFIKRAG